MKRITPTLCLTLFALLTGCAEFTHLTRTRSLNTDVEPQAILIDAKQRAIISTETYELPPPRITKINPPTVVHYNDGSTRTVSVIEYEDQEEVKKRAIRENRFCAEPSPDALSAIAASQGLSFSRPEGADVTQTLSLAEGAASLGLRTQSIQLMRDAMYRICEGYISGAMNKPTYQALQRRLQNTMVAILAIEQLTGVQKAAGVSIGSSAVIGAAELVGKYTQLTEESRAKVREAEGKVTTATATLESAEKALQDEQAKESAAKLEIDSTKNSIMTAAGSTATLTATLKQQEENLANIQDEIKKKTEARDTSKKALDDAKATLAEREASLDSYNKARIASLSGSGSSSVSVAFEDVNSGSKLTDASVIAVSKDVKDIVQDTLRLNFNEEACSSIVLNMNWDDKVPPNSFAQECLNFIKEKTNLVAAITQLTIAQITPTTSISLPNITPQSGAITLQSIDSSNERFKSTIDALNSTLDKL